jgi:hypothetical protein
MVGMERLGPCIRRMGEKGADLQRFQSSECGQVGNSWCEAGLSASSRGRIYITKPTSVRVV